MIDQIDLKLSEHVSIVIKHLPQQNCDQRMYRYREKLKMAYYRGQFLRNRELKSAETTWVGYYHPYASLHETGFETDAQIWRECKNG